MKPLMKTFALALTLLGLAACANKNNNGINGYNQYGQPIDQNGNVIGGAATCAPIQSGAISFSGTGARVSTTDILAGVLPQGSRAPGTYGNLTVGAAGYGVTAGGLNLTRQSQYGNIQMSLGQNGSISGTLQLSQQTIAMLMQMMGGGYYGGYAGGYTGSTAANQCISSVSIDATYTSYNYGYGGQATGMINLALVYLGINGQMYGPIPIGSYY